jgi:hypothetical protein
VLLDELVEIIQNLALTFGERLHGASSAALDALGYMSAPRAIERPTREFARAVRFVACRSVGEGAIGD